MEHDRQREVAEEPKAEEQAANQQPGPAAPEAGAGGEEMPPLSAAAAAGQQTEPPHQEWEEPEKQERGPTPQQLHQPELLVVAEPGRARHHLLRHSLPVEARGQEALKHFDCDSARTAIRKINKMPQKELQATFAKVYGVASASNNNSWLRKKLIEACLPVGQSLDLGTGLRMRKVSPADLVQEGPRRRRKRRHGEVGLGASADNSTAAEALLALLGEAPGQDLSSMSDSGEDYEVEEGSGGDGGWSPLGGTIPRQPALPATGAPAPPGAGAGGSGKGSSCAEGPLDGAVLQQQPARAGLGAPRPRSKRAAAAAAVAAATAAVRRAGQYDDLLCGGPDAEEEGAAEALAASAGHKRGRRGAGAGYPRAGDPTGSGWHSWDRAGLQPPYRPPPPEQLQQGAGSWEGQNQLRAPGAGGYPPLGRDAGYGPGLPQQPQHQGWGAYGPWPAAYGGQWGRREGMLGGPYGASLQPPPHGMPGMGPSDHGSYSTARWGVDSYGDLGPTGTYGAPAPPPSGRYAPVACSLAGVAAAHEAPAGEMSLSQALHVLQRWVAGQQQQQQQHQVAPGYQPHQPSRPQPQQAQQAQHLQAVLRQLQAMLPEAAGARQPPPQQGAGRPAPSLETSWTRERLLSYLAKAQVLSHGAAQPAGGRQASPRGSHAWEQGPAPLRPGAGTAGASEPRSLPAAQRPDTANSGQSSGLSSGTAAAEWAAHPGAAALHTAPSRSDSVFLPPGDLAGIAPGGAAAAAAQEQLQASQQQQGPEAGGRSGFSGAYSLLKRLVEGAAGGPQGACATLDVLRALGLPMQQGAQA